MTDLRERIGGLSPEKRRLLELLLRERGLDAGGRAILPRPPGGNEAPLSHAQQRLWMLDQLITERAAYNVPVSLRLRGELNVGALEASLAEVVRRHESLRTHFVAKDGVVVQVVDEAFEFSVERRDLRALPEREREAAADRLCAEEARRPFDLAHGPVLRATLLRLAEDDYVALLVMHHIVADDWSMKVLVAEVARLYEAFSVGEPSPLGALPVQYADYAAWQREWMRSDAYRAQLDFWKRQLAGGPRELNLQTGRPRPAFQTFRGAMLRGEFGAELTDAVKALARAEEATLFMALLAVFNLLLAHHAKQDDIIVGTPVANRGRPETEGLIGCFINTLALRTRLGGDPTFRRLLGRVRETTTQAFSHQDVPFEKLVEELRVGRDPSRTPLFQVVLSMHNVQAPPLTLRGLTLTPREVELGVSKLDLLLNVWETGRGLGAALEYNADLFDESFAARLLRHFGLLLGEAAAHPDARLSEIATVVAEDERREQREREAGLAEASRMTYRKVRRRGAVVNLVRQGDGS